MVKTNSTTSFTASENSSEHNSITIHKTYLAELTEALGFSLSLPVGNKTCNSHLWNIITKGTSSVYSERERERESHN